MSQRTRARRLLSALFVCLAFLGGACRSPQTGGEREVMLGHTVFFTLEDDSPEAIARLVDACKEYLADHPGTVFFAAGTRAVDLAREVNDTSFDVALQLVFESHAAHDAYQVHARHAQFIEENRDNWKDVRVFDFEL